MSYPAVTPYLPNEREHRRQLAVAVNSILRGKMNAVSMITLTANAATTTITDERLTIGSFIGFMPVTANAAAELTSIYVTDQNTGSAVIHHSNNAKTDKTFILLIIG